MPKCVFEGCSSGCRKKGVVINSKIVLHRFPKDDEMRLLWQKQINKAVIYFDSAVVCSLHFKPYHYNLPKNPSYNKKYVCLLKEDVIPLSRYGVDFYAYTQNIYSSYSCFNRIMDSCWKVFCV